VQSLVPKQGIIVYINSEDEYEYSNEADGTGRETARISLEVIGVVEPTG
jgi:hypothetical protein